MLANERNKHTSSASRLLTSVMCILPCTDPLVQIWPLLAPELQMAMFIMLIHIHIANDLFHLLIMKMYITINQV